MTKVTKGGLFCKVKSQRGDWQIFVEEVEWINVKYELNTLSLLSLCLL